MTLESGGRPALLREAGLVAGLLALFGLHFARTRPTNFGGWDEWLVIDLTARGIAALPFEGRPFSLAFNLVGSLLTPHGVGGYQVVHVLYLLGAATFLMYVLRASGAADVRLAWCAAAFACVWAPLDDLRLDSVLLANYSGAAFASMAAILLLVEARRRSSLPLLVTAAIMAAFVIRVLEASAALLCLAPLCLLPLGGDRRTLARFAGIWLVITGVALAFAALPVLMPPAGGNYQTQGLGFDPQPVRVATRLLRLLGFELLPLVTPTWGEVFGWPAGLAALGFGALWWAGRPNGGPFPEPARHGRLAVAGLLAAALALLIFALSPAIRIPARTQILAAPGMGLLLASAAFGLAAPFGRHAYLIVGVLGAWIAGVGTGRTAAMQREWDARSFWSAQRTSLESHLREAPDLVPGTFVVLLDGVSTWPATFTYHHAVSYLYARRATGMSWGAEPFLYPAAFGPEGLLVAPLESIRSPWSEPVRLYPYDHLVVLRQRPDGTVALAETWPTVALGPLPPGARYAPRTRLLAGPPGPRSRILAEPSLWDSIPR